MTDDRYIKLNGDPIHEPLWKTFHLSASAQAGGLLTVITAAANYNNPKQALLHLATGLATIVGLNILMRPVKRFTLRHSFKDYDEKLCIDTKPDGKTPPTKPDHILASESAVTDSKRLMLWVMASNAVAIPSYTAIAQNIMQGTDLHTGDTFSAIWALSWLGLEVSILNRFNHVVKEDWVITDTPKKVEVKQEEKVPLGLTPQPQAN